MKILLSTILLLTGIITQSQGATEKTGRDPSKCRKQCQGGKVKKLKIEDIKKCQKLCQGMKSTKRILEERLNFLKSEEQKHKDAPAQKDKKSSKPAGKKHQSANKTKKQLADKKYESAKKPPQAPTLPGKAAKKGDSAKKSKLPPKKAAKKHDSAKKSGKPDDKKGKSDTKPKLPPAPEGGPSQAPALPKKDDKKGDSAKKSGKEDEAKDSQAKQHGTKDKGSPQADAETKSPPPAPPIAGLGKKSGKLDDKEKNISRPKRDPDELNKTIKGLQKVEDPEKAREKKIAKEKEDATIMGQMKKSFGEVYHPSDDEGADSENDDEDDW